MNKFGITGGIGSGKTYVSRLLEQRGFAIFNCDTVARRLMSENSSLQKELSSLIGSPIMTDGGQLDKQVIGAYLFSSPEHINNVNALVHPRVREAFRLWCSQREQQLSSGEDGYSDEVTCQWIGMECSILFESHFDDLVDFIASVYASEDIRVQRVKQRDGLTRQQVLDRMKRQLPEEEKIKRSDFIFQNGEKCSVESQIEKFVSTLKSVGNR